MQLFLVISLVLSAVNCEWKLIVIVIIVVCCLLFAWLYLELFFLLILWSLLSTYRSRKHP